jgi:hypothetical protein
MTTTTGTVALLRCLCGKAYRPGTDGRHRHRLLHGHTPMPGPSLAEHLPAADPEPVMSSACETRSHRSCRGRCHHDGRRLACECWCHQRATTTTNEEVS